MYQHILVATDGSDLASKALEHGVELAKCMGARVTIVTVTEPWSALDMAEGARQGEADPVHQFEEMAAASAKRILDRAVARGSERGMSCEPVHVKDRHPAEGIIATIKDRGCDLVVMGSHGRRGISRLLLGSQAYEVVTLCRVPALIVR